MSSARPIRWHRSVFLGSSAALLVAVLVAAREVMLPFILALLIAYVLTPLVVIVQRQRVPSGLAVLIVYVFVLGSLAGFARGISPRIASEVRNLQTELPALVSEAKNSWLPALADRLRTSGPPPAPPPPPETTDSAAFRGRPQADGSFAVDVGSGMNVVETKGGFMVEPAHDKSNSPFDVGHIIADFAGRTFAYARENSLEVARVIRQVVSTVSRAIFVFFITLMLAAYVIVTRERIYAFFRSIVTPGGRASFDALCVRIDAGLSGVVRGQLAI